MSDKKLNKIDFEVLVSVDHANPNGDPLNGNRPRTDYDDIGEMSDVCIKRKVRNRMIDLGHDVFVQSVDKTVDGFTNLQARLESIQNKGMSDSDIAKAACEKWLDVRAFGQVIAIKQKGKGKTASEESTSGTSIGIRGPVSIQYATSVSPVEVKSIQITKSVSNDSDGKGSDTMGRKHMVKYGLYVVKGSINPQLASKTGFSYDDAQVIKSCLASLFVNDASSARPEGSMEVRKLYWWEHDCFSGRYPSAQVHRSLHVTLKPGIDVPSSFDDYVVTLDKLEGLEPEIIDGE